MPIPTISDSLQGLGIDAGAVPMPYPAATKHVVGLVNGVHTDLSSVYFADKILVTISQGGRLAQWVSGPYVLTV